MDLLQILNRLDRFEYFLGITVSEQSINGVLIKIDQKGNLHSEETFQGLDSLMTVNKDIPICLMINSRKILSQSMSVVVDETNYSDNFNLLVPNGKQEEFVINYQGNYIGVIRKNVVESFKKEFSHFFLERYVVSTSLQTVGQIALASYVMDEAEINETILGNYHFQRQDGKYQIEQRASSESLVLGNFQVGVKEVPAFCAVFNHMLDQGITNSESIIELHAKRVISKAFLPVLMVLLVLVSVNAWLFYSFDKDNAILKMQTSQYQNDVKKVKALQDYLDQNIRYIPSSPEPVYSRLLDEIGHDVPKNISLNAIRLIRSEEFNPSNALDKLEVEGVAESPEIFGQWIVSLSDYQWVTAVETQRFVGSGNIGGSFLVVLKLYVDETNP